MPSLRGRLVELRPLEASDAAALLDIHRTPEVLAWWGPPAEAFPEDDPDATRLTVLHEGRVVGMAQFVEEAEPAYRHAAIDLFLHPAVHGRGLGTDVVRTLAEHLLTARGHHRVTIDPALENHAAVRCYEKAGFRRVGVTRTSWRDPDGVWRDGLLMELVREPG